jgi:hypothetical protein
MDKWTVENAGNGANRMSIYTTSSTYIVHVVENLGVALNVDVTPFHVSHKPPADPDCQLLMRLPTCK